LRTAGTPWGQPPSPGVERIQGGDHEGHQDGREGPVLLLGSAGGRSSGPSRGLRCPAAVGALQSSTESSAEGIADLHRVTLAVWVICQVRGRLHHLGPDPSRAGRRLTHTGRRWPDRRSRQPRPSRHDTPSGLPLLHVGPPASGSSAAPPSARPTAARRSTGTAANQWQLAQVANQAGRNGDVQDRRWPDPPGRVRPGAARGQAVRRLQVPTPHMTKVGDACTVRFPKASAYPFFCRVRYAQAATPARQAPRSDTPARRSVHHQLKPSCPASGKTPQRRLTRPRPTGVVVVIPLDIDTDLADARYHRSALRLLAQWLLRSAVAPRPRTAR
jgi:hypothetical protein